MSFSSHGARRIGVATVLAAACTAALVPGTAAAASRPWPGAGALTSAPISDAAWAAGRAKYGRGASAQQALDAYWTAARLRAAKPVEESAFYKEAVARGERRAAEAQRTAAGPSAKAPRPLGAPFSVAPADPAVAEDPSRAYNPNLTPSAVTARTNGKVFFTRNGQAGWQCSAAIVNSEGRNTVWTAGHCLHPGPGGAWHTDWTFIPAYDDDLPNWRPYGTWWARQLYTRTAWINNANQSEDMGVALMWPNSAGTRIVDFFGGHGFQVNLPKTVWQDAFGYPAQWPFDGGNLLRCWGSASPEWTSGTTTSETIKIPCDFNGGASGGPWLYAYNGGHGNLNGVNSRAGSGYVYSPYFDNTAWAAYNDTRYR